MGCIFSKKDILANHDSDVGLHSYIVEPFNSDFEYINPIRSNNNYYTVAYDDRPVCI
jgi:hypothetical protein